MVRIVSSAAPGGVYGGLDDPILNDKVMDHYHEVYGNTGVESASHNHSGSTNVAGSHNHEINIYNSGSLTSPGFYGGNASLTANGNKIYSGTVASHSHGFTSGVNSNTHYHSFNVNSRGPRNAAGGTSNLKVGYWFPRYADMILCERQS
jgi:hypothetical protein